MESKPPEISPGIHIPSSPDFESPPQGEIPLGGRPAEDPHIQRSTIKTLAQIIEEESEGHSNTQGSSIHESAQEDNSESKKGKIKRIGKTIGSLVFGAVESDFFGGNIVKFNNKLSEIADELAKKDPPLTTLTRSAIKTSKEIGSASASTISETANKTRSYFTRRKTQKIELKKRIEEDKKLEIRERKLIETSRKDFRELDRKAKEARRQNERNARRVSRERLKSIEKQHKVQGGITPAPRRWSGLGNAPKIEPHEEEIIQTEAEKLALKRRMFTENLADIAESPHDKPQHYWDLFEQKVERENFIKIVEDMREMISYLDDRSESSIHDMVVSFLGGPFYNRYGVERLSLHETDKLRCLLSMLMSDEERFAKQKEKPVKPTVPTPVQEKPEQSTQPSIDSNPEFDDSANNAAYFAAQRLREQRRGSRRRR